MIFFHLKARSVSALIIFSTGVWMCCAASVQAQQRSGADLPGSWSVQRYDVETTKTLNRRTEKIYLHERRTDDSLNVLLQSADLDLHVEFRGDSSYSLKRRFQRHVEYFERGTWSLAGILHMYSLTHDEASLFDGALVQWQDAQHIVLVFHLGKAKDALWLRIAMQRSEAVND